jgi:hypothetical protein
MQSSHRLLGNWEHYRTEKEKTDEVVAKKAEKNADCGCSDYCYAHADGCAEQAPADHRDAGGSKTPGAALGVASLIATGNLADSSSAQR